MNIFTNDDYRKIQAWLKANAIKDSDLEQSETTIPDEDIITIVQKVNGIPTNFKINIKDFLNSSLNKIIIQLFTANAIKVNNSLVVDIDKIIINEEENLTLQAVFDRFEDNKLNRHTDDTFEGNLIIKKDLKIGGSTNIGNKGLIIGDHIIFSPISDVLQIRTLSNKEGTFVVGSSIKANGDISDKYNNQLNDVNSASKGWNIEYQDPSIDEPTVRAKYVLKDYKGVPKGNPIKVYKDSAITNVYLGTTEDICDENTGEVTKKPIQNNNEALSIVYRLDTGKYSLVNVPIGIFVKEAEFDKYRGLGITENGQVFIKLANDIESSNYLHFNDSGEVSADGIENRILQDLGTIINSVADDGTMWGQYKKEEGTKDSPINEASRWGQYKQAEADRNERLNSLENNVDALSSNLPRVINKTISSSDVSLALSNGKEDLGTDTIIEAATPTQAGVMSAQDKIDINNLKDNVGELTKQLYEIYTVYGIEFDTAISSPTCTRIGRLDLHRTLPIQSKMRGCLLDDDGNVVKYLDAEDWTNEDRTGSSGQVMVEIPMHYRRFDTEGTKRRVYISELSFPGCEVVPKAYVSAYEATVQRSTSKLCSVVNDDADYRGGNNNANLDGQYNSFLGRPATTISLTLFRNYARKRKSGSTEWNCYTYDIHKTLFWLFVVEYATLNSQAGYNSEPTSEGYRQGGLGEGVTTWNWSEWAPFNGIYPFVPCGHTDSLGNRTGVISYTAKNDDESITKTFYVPRYRGVENPFGHIWKWTDGCSIQVSATQENGGTGLSKAFICHDPANFQDSNYANYSHVGNIDRVGGYIKEVLFGVGGEILPKLAGGGSTTYFCDHHWTDIPTSGEALRGLVFGGSADTSTGAGLAFAGTNYAPSSTATIIGSRLCFIPATE